MKEDVDKLLDKTPKGFENKKAYRTFEKLLEQLEDAEANISHYLQSTVEGRLAIEHNDKFSLKGIVLSCGSQLEMYDRESNEWFSGRVEYRHKDPLGYYFYCYDLDNPNLYEGMRVRKRVEEVYKERSKSRGEER